MTNNPTSPTVAVKAAGYLKQDTPAVLEARAEASSERQDPARQLPMRLRKRRRLERLNGRQSTTGGRKYRHRKYQWEETP